MYKVSTRNHYVLNVFLCFFIIFLSTQLSERGFAETPSSTVNASENTEPQVFMGFGNIRTEVLHLIGKVTTRIWLATTFLSDGDIAAALYVAQYRKIDVKILLGKRKAAAYMSRLDFIKKQNIPVFLYPNQFKPVSETAFIIDNRLFYVNSELDFLTKSKEFKLTEVSTAAGEAFKSDFEKAFQAGVPAVPKAIPLVGHSRGGGYYYQGPRRPTYSPEEVQGSFSYDFVKPEPKPKDFPNQLPRETVLQKKTRVKTNDLTKSNQDDLGKPNQGDILKAESHEPKTAPSGQ